MRRNKAKTIYDTWGYKHNCVNYEPCVLCYGCRHYDPSYIKCEHCAKNFRKNICDTKKHTPKVLSMMVPRQKTEL